MSRLLVRLGIAGGCAIAAATLGQMMLQAPEQARAVAAPAKSIRIATSELGVGTFMDGAKAPFQPWSGAITPDMVEAGVQAEQDVAGSVVVAPIVAGQPILRSRLLMPGQEGFLAAVLHPSMRAISIAVDAVSGNAGHIFPGDHVDVILTQDLARGEGTATGQRLASETILQNVRVIAVDQNLNEDMKQRDPSKVARTITLELGQADAQKVTLASSLGKLSLSLRSLLRQDGPATASGAPQAGPVWAKDVSAVFEPAREAAPPAAEAAARPIRILRGGAAAVTAQ